MAATPSTMRQLGSPLPSFQLTDTRSVNFAAGGGGGEKVTDAYLRGRGPAVVAFICNHCPFVVHIRSGLVEFGRYCQEAGVPFVAISSNDVASHPQDGPAAMAAEAKKHGFTFPYLYDETQDVARAFDAACTPDFFVFDADGKLAYRGQFDAARPSNSVPVTGSDLRAAVQSLLAGKAPSSDQKPSIGCNIKWKK
ncbi:MAG TPA: thioredoxin family protein [Polyangiaceae bacterium]|nr:thioredoxin family protein [Polyangiaceae bacterium]